jgi:FixJ family two-component response regulator
MTETEPVVYIVDDDPSVRRSLERLMKSVGLAAESFASAREFLQHGHREETGCLVLDVRMPEISGLDLQEQLAKADIFLPIIFISGHGTVPMSVRAMKAGAMDFLQKPVADQDLLDSVQRAIDQSRRGRAERDEMNKIQERVHALTQREHEVFSLVVSGFMNKQIADRLKTSEKTIKVHRASIMGKMDAGTLADLVRMAEKAGIHPLQSK